MKSLAFALILFSTQFSFAITDEELYRNFPFYFINPGARSGAMGGAFIALADDATAVEANPAGLTTLTEPEISFEFRNITYDSDKLNSSNFLDFFGSGATLFSSNDLNELNQPAFFSFVMPVGKNLTFAVSRQEILRIKGVIDESLFFTIEDTDVAIIADAQVDQRFIQTISPPRIAWESFLLVVHFVIPNWTGMRRSQILQLLESNSFAHRKRL